MKQHKLKVKFNFGGTECPLQPGVLKALVTKPVKLFEHLTTDCHTKAAKSRHYCRAGRELSQSQIRQLLDNNVIEPSSSPWHAQLVTARNGSHEKRRCLGYSNTVKNVHSVSIHSLISKCHVTKNVTQNSWNSSLDFRSVLYITRRRCYEKNIYQEFEASGQLYQFKGIPFVLENAVLVFNVSSMTLLLLIGVKEHSLF